jgi:multiple sugar transport system substrate-binding protein
MPKLKGLVKVQPRGAVTIGALLLMAFTVAGCLRSDSTQDAGVVTIIFKHGRVSGDLRSFQMLLDRFHQAFPQIRVRDESLPSSSDQQHQIYAINLEGGGEGLDVLAMDVIWVPEFARAGWIRPLEHEFTPDLQREFLSNTIEAVTYQGHVYGVPWNIDAGVLYYRKDLLAKYGRPPPTTWQELVETAQLIVEAERDPRLYGFIWQGREYEGLICNALEFIWGNGGDLLLSDNKTPAPATVDALTFMRNLIAPLHISPPIVLTADEEASRQLFGNRRAIFTRNWPYAYALFEREGSPVQGKTGIIALPVFDHRISASRSAPSTLGGWHLGISKHSRHPAESWELIRFISSAQVQRDLAQDTGTLPTRIALYDDAGLLAAHPVFRTLRPILMSARPRPVTPFYPMLSQIFQSEFSAILAGRRSAQDALRSADRQLSRFLELERL